MTLYRVELRGESREVFVVEAASAEEAAEHWERGDSVLTELYGMDVASVSIEDEG